MSIRGPRGAPPIGKGAHSPATLVPTAVLPPCCCYVPRRAHRRAPAVLPPCSHLGSWLASRSHPPLGVFAPHPLTPLRPHRGRWKKSQSPMVKGSKPSKRTHTKNWLEWFMDFVKERMGLMEPHQKHHFYIADTKKKPNGIAKV